MSMSRNTEEAGKEGEQKQNVVRRLGSCRLTTPVHRIAARLRFLPNPNGHGLGGKR